MDLFDLYAKLTLDSSDYDKGLDDAENKANDLKQRWSTATSSISKGVKSIGTGGGILAALGAGAFKAADSVSKNLDNIDKMSQKLGLSTDAYQEWDYVMNISGTSIDNMAMGLKTLTNKFDDAVGGSESAIKTFERLGLSMDDISGLSREDLFAQVIFAFQDMEDTAERAALANDLLGRSGQELAPLFNTSAEETQNLIAQVRDLGGVMSEEAVAQGAAFEDSLTSLKTAFAGASATLFEKLIPAVTELMDKIAKFISEGGLDKIIEKLEALAPIIGVVVTAIAGFKIISGIVSLVEGFSTAFGVLNAVMAANPIGLVVLAITGLIAAFAALWNSSEEFRQFWIDLWEGIKEAFAKVAEFIGGVFKSIGEFASKAWQGIKDTFSAIGSWFSEKFTAAKEAASKAWSGIKDKMATSWSNIKDAFSNVGSWFSDKFKDAKEKVKDAWSDAKSVFSNIWSKVKEGFTIKDALGWGKDMLDNFVDGIKSKVDAVKDAVKGVGNKIKSFLGFSEPEEGPLSNFHTYAPDMMKLFAKGIKDNENVVTDQIARSFDIESDMPLVTSTRNYDTMSAGGNGGASLSTITNLLTQLVNKPLVELSPDENGIFNIVRKQNIEYTKMYGESGLA